MSKHTIEVDLKWFHFGQNNSGGSFVVDENVAEDVFIQARNAEEAIAIGQRFMDNSDSCPCCGDRWSFYVDDSDGSDEPLKYGEPITKPDDSGFSLRKDPFVLHHYDGKVEKVARVFKGKAA